MITLLTDFGTRDYFVGAMKGVILSINPAACVVDITHDIPAHDIEAGAFTLLTAYGTFPANTIHVAIVDPGVGSDRRPILVSSVRHFFVAPNNGLLSYIYEREPGCRVFHLTNDKYFRQPVSATFHGRDVFAPVAAAMSNGIDAESLGSEIEDYKRLAPLAPQVLSDGAIKARIIHIDRFGNCISNLTRDVLTEEMIAAGALLQVGGHQIKSIRRFFAEPNAAADEPFAVWGSADFLEIIAFRESAACLLGIERDQEVIVSGL